MRSITPMSFDEYKKLANHKDKENTSAHTGNQENQIGNALSPFASGASVAVSTLTRKKILDYTHPVDGTIVKSLDNPSVNKVLSKIVQASIDANYGITLSTGIHVTPKTNPELYRIVEECANELGIAIPYVIVSSAMNGINACTAGTNQFSFVMISSLLPMVMSRDETKFVIGHEFGHLAMGHALYHTAGQMIGAMGAFVPVVGGLVSKAVTFPLNAWSRRSEITADRAGLICCRDLEVAKKALFRLEAGLYNTNGIDIDEYVKESERMLSNSQLGKLSEFTHSHPLIPKRIKALELFAKSEVYAQAIGAPITSGMLGRQALNKEVENIIGVLDK